MNTICEVIFEAFSLLEEGAMRALRLMKARKMTKKNKQIVFKFRPFDSNGLIEQLLTIKI